jgi:hypothetical protein
MNERERDLLGFLRKIYMLSVEWEDVNLQCPIDRSHRKFWRLDDYRPLPAMGRPHIYSSSNSQRAEQAIFPLVDEAGGSSKIVRNCLGLSMSIVRFVTILDYLLLILDNYGISVLASVIRPKWSRIAHDFPELDSTPEA